MSHYKPYPAYKESGVEWLGKVPEHWSIGQMKSGIKSLQNGIWGEEPNGGVDDIPCARVADFDRVRLVVQEPLPTIRSIPLAQRIYKSVNTGDLLLEKSGGGEKTTVGVMVQYLGELDVVCSNFVAVVKCKPDISARWLCYVNSHLYALGVNTRSIKQTTGIQNLDSNQYSSELIAFPAFAEQQSIAAHLDRETTRIDALITKKSRFIELLREKRQALITHAVTKGLDSNVKMKDSGVDWLGEVPEHWSVIYQPQEVEAFADAIVSKHVTHEKLYTITQPATDRFNQRLDELTREIDRWEKAWEQARADGNQVGQNEADAYRAEAALQRDQLTIFSGSLGKFVRNYEYVAQLMDFGDPDLEAFASFARLLRKRLHGIGADQVDLAGLMLTHYRLRKDGALVGVAGEPAAPRYLDPITENGLRDPKDAQKAYLADLVEKLNNAFGSEISETDKVALAVHVSEKLRGDQVVMAQVEHNTKEQAMKANLPQAAVQIIVGAMQSHQAMATKLLSDESTRGLFLDVVYDLLKRDSGQDLMRHARA